MIRVVLTFFAMLASGTAVLGSCRVVARRPAAAVAVVKNQVAVAAAVVVPVAIFAPVVAVPSYGAVYAPPAAATPALAPAPQPAAEKSQMDQVLDALRAIDGRLRKLEGEPPVPEREPKSKAKAPAASTALTLLGSRCASCHEAKTSAEKGGGFTLLEGAALAKLTDRQMRRVITMTYSGRMPPRSHGAALTDAEVSQIIGFFDK